MTNNLISNPLKRISSFFIKSLPLLILLLGGLLRFLYLGSVPGGMHQDETFVAWNAFALFHDGIDSAGHRFPVYMADWGDGHSALYSYLLLPLLALNGGHSTPFLSRLPQAVIGTLTLWTVYCLFQKMFGRKAALWGEFLLAVCPWHIMMCRWGLDANLAPGFLIFGLYFFLKGLEDKRFLLLSALTYGLSLYCYAVIWPIVPLMLLLQIIYGFCHKKLSFNRWSIASALLLFVMALPLLLFIMVNSGLIPEIRLPFLTIPAMSGYRGGEIAITLSDMWSNLKTTGALLLRQNIGAPYDILLPYGLFYNIGRIFIVIGFLALTCRLFRSLLRKEFAYEYFIFVQLIGGGVVALLVTAVLHQVNALFIPLVLCEAYGIWWLIDRIQRTVKSFSYLASPLLVGIYLVALIGFQKSYYTDYKELVNAYFGQGIQESVEYAMEQNRDIIAERGVQWPRLLLFSKTLPSEYLAEAVYKENGIEPFSFRKDNITFYNGIDYENIRKDCVYIIYFTDVPVFEEAFQLTRFYDWYVAVPKE